MTVIGSAGAAPTGPQTRHAGEARRKSEPCVAAGVAVGDRTDAAGNSDGDEQLNNLQSSTVFFFFFFLTFLIFFLQIFCKLISKRFFCFGKEWQNWGPKPWLHPSDPMLGPKDFRTVRVMGNKRPVENVGAEFISKLFGVYFQTFWKSLVVNHLTPFVTIFADYQGINMYPNYQHPHVCND